ncbi:hypothetical protein FE810_14115 [Thalassotalea litorea]|uniref:Uncharacterized protein n=1 Tax=Thalassotalea litorea TaxID=2020715 RepID=A0A5R9IDI1_9GAMM|nr:hypothetical protein [Thalassotalea litorea]TLU61641.1 hypothetical protein FE810_14115 [Thalassotalea litorea]
MPTTGVETPLVRIASDTPGTRRKTSLRVHNQRLFRVHDEKRRFEFADAISSEYTLFRVKNNLTSRHSLTLQGIYRHSLNGGYVPLAAC